jgi:ribosomal protein RSM22 (predicted rRNA methylase)
VKPAPLYPASLENWWHQRLLHRYGDPQPTKLYSRIEPHIRQVSDSFTRDRTEHFRESYQGKENLLAYGLFFFPQTYGRTRLIMDELTHIHGWTPPKEEKCRILDLGCGLGSSSLAAVDHLRQHPGGIEITAVEQHAPCTEIRQHLIREVSAYANPVRWNHLTGDFRNIETWAPRPNFRWDLILLSFSLNEAFSGQPPEAAAEWLDQILGRLNPGGLLIIIEPALKETSERLETIRDLLLASYKNQVWAPCLHRMNCPARSSGQFWCHEARKWTPPESLLRLNKTLHREIETLKFSFLALSRTPPPVQGSGPNHVRMVSPVSKSQGRLHFHGCHGGGQIGHYDLLTRHLDSVAKKKWWETERGTVLRDLNIQPLGSPDQFRLTPPPSGDSFLKP